MSHEVIQLDANELAQKIIDKMSTETVGNIIRRVLQTQLPKEEEVRRQFDWAVQEVSKEYFLNYLKNDPQFLAKLKKQIEENLTSQMVKAAVEKVSDRITRGF
jgi:ribonuclease D